MLFLTALQDFASVYIDKLKFLRGVNTEEIWVRTSTEDRTYQVAGGLLFGMDSSVNNEPFKVHNEPASVRTSSVLLLNVAQLCLSR